jgi:hypothetical protein
MFLPKKMRDRRVSSNMLALNYQETSNVSPPLSTYTHLLLHVQIHLPPEIWQLVLQDASRRDLVAISCVSAFMRLISLEFLFKEIVITVDPLRDSTKQRHRIRAMMRSPAINENVRSVRLCASGVLESSLDHTIRTMTNRFLPKGTAETAKGALLKSFPCLGRLSALTIERVTLEYDEYEAILSAPTLKHLRIRDVSLKGSPRKSLISSITELEVYWSKRMEGFANQLFLDLAPTLKYLRVDTSVELPPNFHFPVAPNIHTLHFISNVILPALFYPEFLDSYLLQSRSIVELKLELELYQEYAPPPSSLPHLERLAVLAHSTPFLEWASNRQVKGLELMNARDQWSTPIEVTLCATSARSVAHLHLTIEWLVAAATLHLIASSSASFISIFLVVRPQEGFMDTIAKFTRTATEPWTAVENLDITLEWNGERSDLQEFGVFRRWVNERVEDVWGGVKRARLDIWRRPCGVFRRFDASEDDIEWWESWDYRFRRRQFPRDWESWISMRRVAG